MAQVFPYIFHGKVDGFFRRYGGAEFNRQCLKEPQVGGGGESVCMRCAAMDKACGFRSTANGFISKVFSFIITVNAFITTAFRFRCRVNGVIPYV